jgi:monovalent cation/hydrogen antiporter
MGLVLLLAAVAVIVAVNWVAERTGLPSAALESSLMEIRRNMRAVVSSSVALVLLTACSAPAVERRAIDTVSAQLSARLKS